MCETHDTIVSDNFQTFLHEAVQRLAKGRLTAHEREEVQHRTTIDLVAIARDQGFTRSARAAAVHIARCHVNKAIRGVFRRRRLLNGYKQVQGEQSAAPGDVLATLIREEARRELYAAIAGLPRQDQAIVWLRFFEGLKLREIAESLSLANDNVVSTSLRRSLRVLRAELDGRGAA